MNRLWSFGRCPRRLWLLGVRLRSEFLKEIFIFLERKKIVPDSGNLESVGGFRNNVKVICTDCLFRLNGLRFQFAQMVW